MAGNENAADTAQDLRRFSRRWLRGRFPLADELRAYNRGKFRADLLAGATVSLVSIPQAIGFALIAGLPPLMVIMSVVVGGFVYALFTSSHHLVFGPTNSMSIILAATIFSFKGGSLEPAEIALLLALLIGSFQLAAGLTQLGKLTQFISRSVIIAYSTAIGLLLAAGQFSNLLGIEASGHGNFLQNLWHALGHVVTLDLNMYAALMGVLTLVLFYVVERFLPKIPVELVVLVSLALISKWAGLAHLGIHTIRDEGALSAALPSFLGIRFGSAQLDSIPALLSTALAVSILGMLEAVSLGKSLAAKSGQRVDPNQELIAMGLANLSNSAFGAMPGSASFARSGANLQSGGRTQVSSLLSSGIVLIGLFFVTGLINDIPVPCLAAHLIRIGVKLLNPEQLRIAWRATRSDAIVLMVTLAAAFFLKLDSAIYVGIGASLALFLRKASAPSLVEYGFDAAGNLSELEDKAQRRNSAISIVHVEGELFFGAADLFQEQVRLLSNDDKIRVIILRMKNARHLDATSVMSLLELHDYLTKSGRFLIVSGINPDVEAVLRASGTYEKIGADNIFPAEANLTASTKKALLRASHLLQTKKAEVRIFYDRAKKESATNAPFNAPAGDHDSPKDYQI
ncbi:MAG: SulP family inorganic anion transporter [Nibricoccus sp.]